MLTNIALVLIGVWIIEVVLFVVAYASSMPAEEPRASRLPPEVVQKAKDLGFHQVPLATGLFEYEYSRPTPFARLLFRIGRGIKLAFFCSLAMFIAFRWWHSERRERRRC